MLLIVICNLNKTEIKNKIKHSTLSKFKNTFRLSEYPVFDFLVIL